MSMLSRLVRGLLDSLLNHSLASWTVLEFTSPLVVLKALKLVRLPLLARISLFNNKFHYSLSPRLALL